MKALRRLGLAAVLALIVAAAVIVPMPLLLLMPTPPLSLDARLQVGTGDARVNGEYLIGAVAVGPGTLAGAAVAVARDDIDVALQPQVMPAGMDQEIYIEYQQALFRVTVDRAAALGLQAAGYDVDPSGITGSGALVVQVVPGSPADGVLRSGDVITRVDGRTISVADDLRAAIQEPREVQVPRRLEIARDGRERAVTVTPATPPGGSEAVIGVVAETFEPDLPLPVPVELDAGEVGGPSAGLLIALAVYDQAAPDVDLAAGRVVAGTGAIDPQGQVLPVSGVAQKVRAAEAEGADLFLAPAAQADAARGAAQAMQVVGVDSFTHAAGSLGR